MFQTGDYEDAFKDCSALLNGSGPSPSPSPAGCTKDDLTAATDLLAAQQFVKQGQPDQALERLNEAVKLRPDAGKTDELRQQIAQAYFAQAETLQKYRYYDDAIAATKKGITAEPPLSSLSAPPASTAASASRTTSASTSASASRTTSASTSASASRTTSASTSAGPAVPGPLAELSTQHRALWDRWDAGKVAVEALVLLTLLAVLLLLAWQVLQAARTFWRGGRVLISSFDSATARLGEGFADVLKENVTQSAGNRPHHRLDLVSKWADPVSLPTELSTLAPSAGLLDALINLLLKLVPTRDREVTGFIHESSPFGPGVSLWLERRSGGVRDGLTLWKSDYDFPPPAGGASDADGSSCYLLAFPAAVWLLKQMDRDGRLRDLGTDDWQSYAAFGIGSEWQQLGDHEKASAHYRKALAYDPENRAALVNLAKLELWKAAEKEEAAETEGEQVRKDAEQERQQWRDRLKKVRKLSSRRTPSHHCDPFWYRASYILAADRANHASHDQLERRLWRWAACELLLELERGIRDDDRRTCGIAGFLRSVEAEVCVLLAGALTMGGAGPAGAANPYDRRELLNALQSRKVDAGRLVAYAQNLEMGPRARYNLACYYAGIGKRDDALRELETAWPTLDASTRKMAASDGSLEPVRDDSRFKKLVDPAPVPLHSKLWEILTDAWAALTSAR
jgi:tetratricopeptide (TPR) repeat protein